MATGISAKKKTIVVGGFWYTKKYNNCRRGFWQKEIQQPRRDLVIKQAVIIVGEFSELLLLSAEKNDDFFRTGADNLRAPATTDASLPAATI